MKKLITVAILALLCSCSYPYTRGEMAQRYHRVADIDPCRVQCTYGWASCLEAPEQGVCAQDISECMEGCR